MATVTQRLASVENDGCFVEVDYNDQNSQSLLARWANNLDRPVFFWVFLPNGKELFNGTLGIGSSGEFTLSGGDRFNVSTQAPTINLAPWATPTSP